MLVHHTKGLAFNQALGLLLTLLFAVAAPGCTSRAAPADVASIWPDTFLDASRRDGGQDSPVAPDGRPDQGRDLIPLEDQALDQTTQKDALAADTRDSAPPPVGWKAVKAPTAEDLHAVACVAGQVFAAGDKGTLLHHDSAASGAVTFIKQSLPTQADLHTVSFADLTYGVTAGNDAMIWETKDQGTTWSVAPQCSAFFFDTFHALHLFSPAMGSGAGAAASGGGGGIKYFTAGSWVCSTPTYLNETFYDVFRLGLKGWIVGDTKGKVYRCEDNGVTWAPIATGINQILRGVHFTGPAHGVAVGHLGTVLRSTDGEGKVWAKVSAPLVANLWDVFFFDADRGWAVGEGGAVVATTDGGKTWKVQTSGTIARLEGVCFTSAKTGWIVGAGGTILRTTTGGL